MPKPKITHNIILVESPEPDPVHAAVFRRRIDRREVSHYSMFGPPVFHKETNVMEFHSGFPETTGARKRGHGKAIVSHFLWLLRVLAKQKEVTVVINVTADTFACRALARSAGLEMHASAGPVAYFQGKFLPHEDIPEHPLREKLFPLTAQEAAFLDFVVKHAHEAK